MSKIKNIIQNLNEDNFASFEKLDSVKGLPNAIANYIQYLAKSSPKTWSNPRKENAYEYAIDDLYNKETLFFSLKDGKVVTYTRQIRNTASTASKFVSAFSEPVIDSKDFSDRLDKLKK